MPFLSSLNELGSESRRLLHGRGGHFPGWEHVVVDWFAPILLVTFYADEEGNDSILAGLIDHAKQEPDVSAIVVQERHLRGTPKRVIYGEVPDNPVATEAGLSYHLALDRNQNHGFFLDMNPGREWVRKNAPGKSVLNLFAYTCSLSVAALAGEAESVVNLDMAGGALSTGRKNHQLNFDSVTCRRASYLPLDLLKSWGRLKRRAPYDLIIVDPPSNQTGSFVVGKDYTKIARRLPELTHAETQILVCLNSPHLDESFLLELFDEFQFEGRLPKAPGFEDAHPERGLKSLIFTP